jgi:hypothetical protein
MINKSHTDLFMDLRDKFGTGSNVTSDPFVVTGVDNILE